MNLTPTEKAFLTDIKGHPAFDSIMQKLADRRVRPYSPKGEHSRSEDWAYDSGFVNGVLFVVKTLGYDNDRRNQDR